MNRRLLAAVLALLLAVLGGVVLVGWVNGADARALAGTRTVPVLVIVEDVPAGTPVEELGDAVELSELPAMSVSGGALDSLDSVAGFVTGTDFAAGEQLVAARFEDPDAALPAGTVEVPTGLSEVSVLLDPQRAVGSRLAAGDTVGVYVSQVLSDGTGQTHAVLHGVLVTQVQGAPAPTEADPEADAETVAAGAPTGALLVTLAVRSADAESVVYGQEHGTVYLSLEPAGADTADTRVIDPGSIYAGATR
ncbi:MAG: hypothetical protein JWQ53_2098 [Klenkia sp.]|nr:hypothetical protein [Klenkia sp.]